MATGDGVGGAQEDGEGRVMEAKQFLRNIPDMRPEGWGGFAGHAEHSAPDWTGSSGSAPGLALTAGWTASERGRRERALGIRTA